MRDAPEPPLTLAPMNSTLGIGNPVDDTTPEWYHLLVISGFITREAAGA
jgi:hypothetical protein